MSLLSKSREYTPKGAVKASSVVKIPAGVKVSDNTATAVVPSATALQAFADGLPADTMVVVIGAHADHSLIGAPLEAVHAYNAAGTAYRDAFATAAERAENLPDHLTGKVPLGLRLAVKSDKYPDGLPVATRVLLPTPTAIGTVATRPAARVHLLASADRLADGSILPARVVPIPLAVASKGNRAAVRGFRYTDTDGTVYTLDVSVTIGADGGTYVDARMGGGGTFTQSPRALMETAASLVAGNREHEHERRVVTSNRESNVQRERSAEALAAERAAALKTRRSEAARKAAATRKAKQAAASK